MSAEDSQPILMQLRAFPLSQRQIALLWLSQAGFAIRTSDTTLLIDPFLSPHPERLIPPPLAPSQMTGIDLLLLTHEHLDHFDPETVRGLVAASPTMRIVVPTPLVPRVLELGIYAGQVTGMQPGETLRVHDVVLEAVPASHGVTMADAYGFGREETGGLYRFLGYVIRTGDVALYHAGDTVLYEGMEELLRTRRIDVALLPINGRDETREAQGIVGNLNPAEAARLASSIGADLLVPMHYDLITGNLGSPADLVEEVRQRFPYLSVAVLGRGRPFVYTKVER